MKLSNCLIILFMGSGLCACDEDADDDTLGMSPAGISPAGMSTAGMSTAGMSTAGMSTAGTTSGSAVTADDDCAGVTCEHEGICIDGVNSYTCECRDGFSGVHCELEQCGDGSKTLSELCDDGNLEDGDGCSSECFVEWAFSCNINAQPNLCESICGDGLKAHNEPCDDGNLENDDGCSSSCTLEVPLTFNCALNNHQNQLNIAPNYPYTQGSPAGVTLERLATSTEPQPHRLTWDPVLEEAPGCNGLSWSPNATDRALAEFKFLVVLDASWIEYFAENMHLFEGQGYSTLESSPHILFDRVSYLYEAQFGVRLGISRVVSIPGLLEKCGEDLDRDGFPDNLVENDVQDSTNTHLALANLSISMRSDEAGLLRLGVGSDQIYCHSFAPLNGLCDSNLFTNQVKVFAQDGSGRFNHQSAVTLAHEMGHFFGICSDSAHPHCLNAHLANQIPDIMVWDGGPVESVRAEGGFMKFLTSCTPVYDEILCANVKSPINTCSTALTCENEGLDCVTTYWSASPNQSTPRQVRPRSESLPVHCCADEGLVTSCLSSGLGGPLTLDGDQGCSGEMTWPEADRFCRQANRRLCTLEELESATLCTSSGCGYEHVRGWTSTPHLEPSDLIGSYHREPIENGYHQVSLLVEADRFFWSNLETRWELHWNNGELWTGDDCPYGRTQIGLDFERDRLGQITKNVLGLVFLGELYRKQ